MLFSKDKLGKTRSPLTLFSGRISTGIPGITPTDGKEIWCDVVPEIDCTVAVIVAVPSVSIVAKPELFTVATLVADELHVAILVTSLVLPSENAAVAANCCVLPAMMDVLLGPRAIDCMVGGGGGGGVVPVDEPLPHKQSLRLGGLGLGALHRPSKKPPIAAHSDNRHHSKLEFRAPPKHFPYPYPLRPFSSVLVCRSKTDFGLVLPSVCEATRGFGKF